MIALSKLKRGKIATTQCGCGRFITDKVYITKRGYKFVLCKYCACAVGVGDEDIYEIGAFTGWNVNEIIEDLK